MVCEGIHVKPVKEKEFDFTFSRQLMKLHLVQVIYDKLTGRSRGFGFVTMSSVEEVEAAVEQFNGYVSMLSRLKTVC